MARCSRCGEENPERAKFCLNCGQPLGSDRPAAEQRKTVTILFADVVNSTGRGESTDPESTRHMLSRYFDVMKLALERHGGTVEKFIGDAVMSVFGIPTVHEDDALRAVRAAHDLTDALAALNAELAATGWRPISVRIGINTGEVVTGDPASGQTLVTGDAVNVAARLEQAAQPGDILLGATTQLLVRDAVTTEALPPLELKGKAEPVPAYRLVSMSASGAGERRHDTPLVGRDAELRLLGEAFQRAVTDQGCVLFTLLGTAGVGKSRLVHEFLGRVRSGAQVLRARCLPYGEGITYWPIVELTQAAARIAPLDPPDEARAKLAAYLADADGGDAIAERVASAIGLSDAIVPTDEVFWGVRRLLETIARRQPLVVVIDDLQWAEPTLLELVEHVADLSRDAPILLLAIARPELLDLVPHWGGGKLNATTILLEPLSGEQSVKLVTNLVGDAELARALQDRLGATAEGNPLFVEELVAMLIDEGVLHRGADGWVADASLEEIRVPPTVSALVAARLDRLEPPERDLVGRASVVGKVFQRSAVAELSPPERRPELGARLMTLVRKELVRPDRSSDGPDEAFRFRHILVRDAAYGSLPKEQRADLHARFADWLEQTAGDRLHEYQEVIAYHLEQAHAARTELGLTDAQTDALAARAERYLAASGSRALVRRDLTAAVSLMSRAASLTSDSRRRTFHLIDVADALLELGKLPDGVRVYEETREAALAAGDDLSADLVRLLILSLEQFLDPSASDRPLEDLVNDVEARAAAAGDRRVEATAKVARGQMLLTRCLWGEQIAELEAAGELLATVDAPAYQREVERSLLNATRYGPVPASEAVRRFEAAAEPEVIAGPWPMASPLYAMLGEVESARRLYRDGLTYFAERGAMLRSGTMALGSGTVERLAGDMEAAERELDRGIAILEALGETGVLSTLLAQRAVIQYKRGRIPEAEASIQRARERGAEHDIATQAEWRVAAALIAADRGDLVEAERIAHEAVALVEPTDFLELRGEVFEALGHVDLAAGRRDEAAVAFRRSIAEHDRKENRVDAARVRARLEALEAG
jgi:class 3 adenylate cyclase